MPRKLDLRGQQYGKLTVVRQAQGNSRYLTWECRCACGNTVFADSRHLRLGMTVCCEKCRQEAAGQGNGRRKFRQSPGGRPQSDITGKRFGRLTALYATGEVGRNGSVLWHCRCDCGNEVNVTVTELNKGNQKSCGCLKIEYQDLIHDRLHLVDGTCVEWLGGRRERSDNASGHRGIFKKKNGKYSVTIGFKKKILYLGTYEEYEDALAARLLAEKTVHDGFIKAYTLWNEKARKDPAWAAKNPLRYEIEKRDGKIVVHNSMEAEMTGETEIEQKQESQ